MRRVLLGLAISAAAAPACQDEPVAPRPAAAVVPARDRPAAAVNLPACTKRWATGTSGDWAVAGNWTPAGVPGWNSTVCLDAAGTYTVTMVGPKLVNAIVLGGGGANVTLSYSNGGVLTTWNVTTGIQVKAGSTLKWTDPVDLATGFVQVDGTWRADFPGGVAVVTADSIRNGGTIDVNRAELKPLVGAFHNAGTLQATGPAAKLTIVGTAFGLISMEGGTVSGQGSVVATTTIPPLFPPPASYSPPVFSWTAGTIPARLTGAGARLTVIGIPVYLGATTLQGVLELETVYLNISTLGIIWATPVTTTASSLPAGVQLDLTGNGQAILPHSNLGVITVSPVDSMTLWFADPSLNLAPGPFSNAGSFTINAGTARVRLETDSVENSGTLTLNGPADFPSLEWVRNLGTIGVGAPQSLALTDVEFYSDSTGIQTGALHLSGGLLSGVGQVGNVTTLGTQVEPGGVPLASPLGGGIGALTAASLILNPASSVGIDLAGVAAGNHDQLVVTGLVSYAGTLRLREQFPFAGGTCGQVVPIVLPGSVPPVPGSFGVVTGLVPAPGRGWRLDYGTGALQLIGHDPSLAVSRSPAQLTATEGGAGASYSLCLRAAPTASVTVHPTAAGGQLAAMGSQLFTPIAWALPKAVAVSAVNDLAYEPPPQAATITHAVTSADPVYSGAKPGTVTVTIVDNDGSTNLELSLLNAPPVVAVGGQFTLSLRSANLGPDVSVGATFTVPASPGYTYVSSTGTLGCSSDAIVGTSCPLAGLASGAFVDFTVTFQAVQAGTYATAYTVTTIQTDPNPGNNTRPQTITVN